MKYKKRGDGYRSGFEAQVAAQLKRKGVRFHYELTKYPVLVPVHGHACTKCTSTAIARRTTYLPDFTLLDAGILLEAKGKFTGRNRSMLVAFRQQHPGLGFRILFQRDNKLSKISKTRYTDWCKANGIACAVGTSPPKEWLK